MDKKSKQKVKNEKQVTSKPHGSTHRHKEPNLSFYVDDRVALLQKTFSVLKPRDILAMAPECVKDISFDKLKEMCLEELLGISTKRLTSVLEGTEPPSDTESSNLSDHIGQLDAMSLDSISSDETGLSPIASSHKSKKQKRCKHKTKQKKEKKSSKGQGHNETEGNAGLTVLELLELQARARAIKAQLQAEQQKKGQTMETATTSVANAAHTASDDDDVLIKEEPPEVVELVSSDDEKQEEKPPKTEPIDTPTEMPESNENTIESADKIVTKRNDLTIIVPKQQNTKRIKLKRNNVISINSISKVTINKSDVEVNNPNENNTSDKDVITPVQQNTIDTSIEEAVTSTSKKRKKDKKKKKKAKETDASDQDEITLQLSDSEKMDLLQDFNHRKYDKLSTSSSSDESDNSHLDVNCDAKLLQDTEKYDKNDLVSSSKDREITIKTDKVLDKPTEVLSEDLSKKNTKNQLDTNNTQNIVDQSISEVSTTQDSTSEVLCTKENVEVKTQCSDKTQANMQEKCEDLNTDANKITM